MAWPAVEAALPLESKTWLPLLDPKTALQAEQKQRVTALCSVAEMTAARREMCVAAEVAVQVAAVPETGKEELARAPWPPCPPTLERASAAHPAQTHGFVQIPVHWLPVHQRKSTDEEPVHHQPELVPQLDHRMGNDWASDDAPIRQHRGWHHPMTEPREYHRHRSRIAHQPNFPN